MNSYIVLAKTMTRGNWILLIVMASIIVLLLVSAVVIKLRQNNNVISPSKVATSSPTKEKEMGDTTGLISMIEDIQDGIIVTDKNTRFISAIKCTGYDFYSDTLEGKVATMAAFQRFFTTIKEPITFRTSSKIIDIEKPVAKYENRINELTELQDKLKALIDGLPMDSKELPRLYNEYHNATFKINHLKVQLETIKRLSSSDVISDTTQIYVFDWKYNPSDYSYSMTPAEIFATARTALANKAGNMIRELSDAHVKGKVLSQSEMIELCRQYARPFTSEIFPERLVEDSSYFDQIHRSSSYEETSALLSQVLNDEKLAAFHETLAAQEEQETDADSLSKLFV